MYRSLETPRDWTEHMTELLMTQGVPLVGVSTTGTLAGGPPSTDLEYVLPGAKSAITFAVPLDPWFHLGDPRILLALIGCALSWRAAAGRSAD
jgi:hypothetical protein